MVHELSGVATSSSENHRFNPNPEVGCWCELAKKRLMVQQYVDHLEHLNLVLLLYFLFREPLIALEDDSRRLKFDDFLAKGLRFCECCFRVVFFRFL